MRLHCAQVEALHHGASLLQLGRVVWRRRELLDDFSAHARRWLRSSDDRAVSRIALDEAQHLVVPHEHLILAHVVEPLLHVGLDTDLVLVGPHAGRGRGRW